MTAIFRDSMGTFSVDHVEMMQYNAKENKWLVFFNDGQEEYEAQLVSVSE